MKFLVRISTCHNNLCSFSVKSNIFMSEAQKWIYKTRFTIDTNGLRKSTISYTQSIRDEVHSSKKHVKYNHERALGRHFCWGSGAPTIWISKGPKQNLKGTSIEIHYQFSNFWSPLGPQAKFHKGPIGFLGARGPSLGLPPPPPPESPAWL